MDFKTQKADLARKLRETKRAEKAEKKAKQLRAQAAKLIEKRDAVLAQRDAAQH